MAERGDVTGPLADLRGRLANQTALVGVIGLGYVGLPQAVAFAEAGFRVLGFDIDAGKTEAIARGESYLLDIPPGRIAGLVESGRLGATSEFARLGECDAIVICVPTPLTEHREPDLSAIEGTVGTLAPRLRPGQLVVLVSTTYPGTTEELVRPALEASGLRVGREVALGYSPEREDPGNPGFGLRNTPKLVAGCTPACRELTELLYRPVVAKVIVGGGPWRLHWRPRPRGGSDARPERRCALERAGPKGAVASRALEEVGRIVRELVTGRSVTVYLFGSWARGGATRLSDIDVAIQARPPLDSGTLARLRERLEESHVPYRVEVVDLDDVDPALRSRILAEGVRWSG